jgi:hypothetical protein
MIFEFPKGVQESHTDTKKRASLFVFNGYWGISITHANPQHPFAQNTRIYTTTTQ